MGKTPKSKHGDERRRPYNYPRNAQALTKNSGTESRNYNYPTGNVPRRIPAYRPLPYQGIPGPIPPQPYYFGVPRDYRGRYSGITKPLKTNLGRQRRPDIYNKRIHSPARRISSKKKMQSQNEEQNSIQNKIQETNSKTDEQVAENGPEGNDHNEEEEKVEVEEKVETEAANAPDANNEVHDSNGVDNDTNDNAQKDENEDNTETKPKTPVNKEKKTKKSSASLKATPKVKVTSKSKKDKKLDSDTKETDKKEKEKSQIKKPELDNSNLDPVVKIISLQTEKTENDSVIEVPIENNKPEITPSTSTDENTKLTDERNIKDSPRRSTRRSVRHQTPPAHKALEKADSSSVIVLDSDDSISVLEVSRSTQDQSFAKSLRSISGRPSLRTLSALNRSSYSRPYTGGSVSVHSNISNRSVTTTNGSESDSQESKSTQSKSSLWGLFQSNKTDSQVFPAADKESINQSLADDSGNDSEATSEPSFEAASNLSFGKRKLKDDDDDFLETEHEKKKLKEDTEKNNLSTSGLFSLMSSPMNLFTSKLKGDKGKSSTPLQLLKASNMNEDNTEGDISIQREVSDIHYEYSSQTVIEKDSVEGFSDIAAEDKEVASRKWCTIM